MQEESKYVDFIEYIVISVSGLITRREISCGRLVCVQWDSVI